MPTGCPRSRPCARTAGSRIRQNAEPRSSAGHASVGSLFVIRLARDDDTQRTITATPLPPRSHALARIGVGDRGAGTSPGRGIGAESARPERTDLKPPFPASARRPVRRSRPHRRVDPAIVRAERAGERFDAVLARSAAVRRPRLPPEPTHRSDFRRAVPVEPFISSDSLPG
jgi:hypothetical protein